jgi:hypothetical protein
METLFKILVNYGGWGLLLVALLYIIIKAEFTIKYPRSDKK